MTQGQQNLPVKQRRETDIQLYTVEETAEALRVHPQTVRRIIRAGDLPVVRIGRAYRLHFEDILQFIEQRRAKAVISALTSGRSWVQAERALGWTPWGERR